MSDWRPFEPCKENVDRAVGNVFEDRMHGITTTRSVQAAISMERREVEAWPAWKPGRSRPDLDHDEYAFAEVHDLLDRSAEEIRARVWALRPKLG